MAITDYASLRSAVVRWLLREDDPTALDQAEEFIALAEASIRRRVEWFTRVYSQEAGSPFPLSGAEYEQLPPFVRAVRHIWLATADFKAPIVLVPRQDLQRALQNGPAAGIPRVAHVSTQGDAWLKQPASAGPLLWLAPRPQSGLAIDFEYIHDVPPIKTDTTTNGLFLRHPDLYLYGALLESAPFYEHDERIPVWRERFERAVAEVNREREALLTAAPARIALPRSF